MNIKSVKSKIDYWLLPKCDFCKISSNERKLFSDGVGLLGCKDCWDEINKEENARYEVRPRYEQDKIILKRLRLSNNI